MGTLERIPPPARLINETNNHRTHERKETMAAILKIIALLLALGMGLFAHGEPAKPEAGASLTATLIEINEGGYLAVQPDGQQVQIQLHETTQINLPWPPAAGDRITVTYDGRMTRSMPPQVIAQRISLADADAVLIGAVREVDAAGGRILIETDAIGAVWVTLPTGADAAAFSGKGVRVYTTGAVALSMPAQATALSVAETPLAEGEIAYLTDDTLLVDTAQGALRFALPEGMSPDALALGQRVQVLHTGIMALSEPPQGAALAVLVRE
jgi:hypothetical protein